MFISISITVPHCIVGDFTGQWIKLCFSFKRISQHTLLISRLALVWTLFDVVFVGRTKPWLNSITEIFCSSEQLKTLPWPGNAVLDNYSTFPQLFYISCKFISYHGSAMFYKQLFKFICFFSVFVCANFDLQKNNFQKLILPQSKWWPWANQPNYDLRWCPLVHFLRLD